METAWIQIFLLTLTECVAPAGKTVCQESQFELQFLSRAECEVALEQLLSLKEASETVIVDKEKSVCTPTARQQDVYASLPQLVESIDDLQGFEAPNVQQAAPGATGKRHQARLDNLKTCEESKGVAPCKIGEIIIEDATKGEAVEVWRRKDR